MTAVVPFGVLDPIQIETFQNQGYLVVRQVVPSSDLLPLIEVVSGAVDRQTDNLYSEGKITDLCREFDFTQRWYRVLQQFGGQNEVFGWHTSVFSQALFNLIVHPSILDVVGSLTENEIQFNATFGFDLS